MTGKDAGGDSHVTADAESVTLVMQDWCDWCDGEDVELPHRVDISGVDVMARFCSLQCMARWGRATGREVAHER